MKDLLIYYCKYNIWANECLVDFFKKLDPGLLEKEVESSFSSIREMGFHLLSVETLWLGFLKGKTIDKFPLDEENTSTYALLKKWINASKRFLQHVENQEVEFFTADKKIIAPSGNAYTVPIKIMIHHCMNHSTYHRGQLINMLRQLGIKEGLPQTDLVNFAMFVGGY